MLESFPLIQETEVYHSVNVITLVLVTFGGRYLFICVHHRTWLLANYEQMGSHRCCYKEVEDRVNVTTEGCYSRSLHVFTVFCFSSQILLKISLC